MNPDQLRIVARELLDQKIDLDQFIAQVTQSETPDAEIDSAVVDLDRSNRCGFPEVIYGEGKTPEAIAAISQKLLEHGEDVLITRLDTEKAELVRGKLPADCPEVIYNDVSRTMRMMQSKDRVRQEKVPASVVVISAGTSDLPVATEAIETLEWMRIHTALIQDIGVAGPQRLANRVDCIRGHEAIVVVAGMEGALPSVVAGHVDCPVIAVPTSVGYGANFGGVSALLSMLNSCASNVAVVNIDAGFKGGYLAGMIAKRTCLEK